MTSSTRVGGSAQAPERTIVYAIGDIHGRLDLLERLTEQLAVETEAASRDGKGTIAVFLGDYIDKGPDAAGVVEHLIRFRDQSACETIFLRGNHEDVLLSLLDGNEDSARWLEYGGVETLRSYGVSFRNTNPNPSVDRLRQSTANAVPAAHVDFLRKTELYVKLGDYIFVHAGLRPDRLIEEQTDSDMMWFRYYDDEPPIWSGVVVHGHSVNIRPVRGRARIGIDTGAYATDALTALRLEGDRQDFLRVSLDPEDGAIEIDFWDTVDRAFGGTAKPAPEGARARRPRPAKAEAPVQPKAAKPSKAAKPKAARSGKGRPFPAVGAAAAAAALALAAVTIAAVVLYPPATDPDLNELSPQDVAAELRAETEGLAAADPTPAVPQPVQEVQTAETEPAADLRALTPALAGDQPPTDEAAPPAGPPARPQPPTPTSSTRVQIAAAASTSEAGAAWSALRQAYQAETRGKTMETQAVQVGERTLYRTLVAGFASDEDARRFCDRLRQAGRDCIVRAG
jgi:serine/threonine protein phosphatase 1